MLTVATHDGSFHADDVFAYAILRLAAGGAVTLTRTRDRAGWDAADVVFDVGGVFDPATRRYDHHMRDKPLRPSHDGKPGEPYSSAGLVWKDFGPAALRALLPAAPPEAVEDVWARLDRGLIRDVDRMDNGTMESCPGHFSVLVETFNPTFAEPGRDDTDAFLEVAEMAARVLARAATHAFAATLAAGTVAEAARTAEDPRILVLDTRVPWEDAVFDLGLAEALYVIRPAGPQWTVSAVPPERGSFAQRKPLPDSWGGLRDEALARLTGIADATFCHPARFVCGAQSRDGAIALARLAVAD